MRKSVVPPTWYNLEFGTYYSTRLSKKMLWLSTEFCDKSRSVRPQSEIFGINENYSWYHPRGSLGHGTIWKPKNICQQDQGIRCFGHTQKMRQKQKCSVTEWNIRNKWEYSRYPPPWYNLEFETYLATRLSNKTLWLSTEVCDKSRSIPPQSEIIEINENIRGTTHVVV